MIRHYYTIIRALKERYQTFVFSILLSLIIKFVENQKCLIVFLAADIKPLFFYRDELREIQILGLKNK